MSALQGTASQSAKKIPGIVILSEAKNLSWFLIRRLHCNRREISRFAQNDNFLSFSAVCSVMPFVAVHYWGFSPWRFRAARRDCRSAWSSQLPLGTC